MNENLRQDVTISLAANRFGLVALSSETNRSHSSCPGDGSISMTEGSNVDYMDEVRTLEKVEVAVEEGEEKEKVLDKHGRTPKPTHMPTLLNNFKIEEEVYEKSDLDQDKHPNHDTSKLKIACVGDSLTYGYGATEEIYSYPVYLQEMLGYGYAVRNFGVDGVTALRKPATKEGKFLSARFLNTPFLNTT